MTSRFKELHALLTRTRTVPHLVHLDEHMRTLPPGDSLIVGVLGGLVICAGLVGLYALVHSFLIEVPSRGGTVVEGVLGSPRFVNPLLALSDADRDLSALTFAGLMGAGVDGNLVPVLAQSYTVSPDGKVYTFTLREDLKFSDGSPVTPDDIVFTVEKAQDPGLKSPDLPNWANVRAETIDARTVRFTLPKAYAPFLENTTLGILPAHVWRDLGNEEFPFSPLMTNPVGAGPFKVESVKRNGNGVVTSYELVAFPKYALGRPYLDRFRLVFFSREEDLKNALSGGAVDSAYGVPQEGVLRAPFAQVFGIFFNGDENPLFTIPEVRKALSIATDRKKITQDILGGFASPAWGPLPLGSGPDAVQDAISISEGDRIAKAAEVLEDGGFVYDDETRHWTHKKKGLDLAVTIRTSNVPELKAVAEGVRDDWERLGVPVEIELYEPGDLTQNVIRPRRYEALLFGMVVGRERDLFAFWHSSQRNDPGLNIALYANHTIDELLETVRENQDSEERQKALRKINELVAADYPAVFTHTPDFLYATPSGVKGIRLPQIASPSDRFATVATWYRNTEAVWPFFAHE